MPVELCELPRDRISRPPAMQRRQRANHGGRARDGQAGPVIVKDQFLAVPVDDQVRRPAISRLERSQCRPASRFLAGGLGRGSGRPLGRAHGEELATAVRCGPEAQLTQIGESEFELLSLRWIGRLFDLRLQFAFSVHELPQNPVQLDGH